MRILGIRGVPAAHGGFETFAENLARHLVGRGWRVVVYCQDDRAGSTFVDTWDGIERVHIAVATPGPRGTVLFDWKATLHASRHRDLCLTLGYNTAVFCALLRLRGVPNVINMDGIEWRRQKWDPVAKAWFWFNDWAGCWLGDHLVADHPGIRRHLQSRVRSAKITTIPYGADELSNLPEQAVRLLGLEPGRYWTVIARAEPENSILTIVRAFSRKKRNTKLAIFGKYEPHCNAYHHSVQASASDEVIFLGPIYDRRIVDAVRYHAEGYLHGHQVGGTNPSLVEAMGAGNAVIAHNNEFNRWVAGDSANYFDDEVTCSSILDRVIGNTASLGDSRKGTVERFRELFTWKIVLADYEALLERWLP